MEVIRLFWPVILGLLLLVVVAVAVLGKREGVSFRERNMDGTLLLASLGILFLLLAGSQAALHRSLGSLIDVRREAVKEAKILQRANQELSLRFKETAAQRDSLLDGWEWADEIRDPVDFRGRVLDDATGEPVSFAPVRVTRIDPDKQIRERRIAEALLTDGDGRFSLTVPRLAGKGALVVDLNVEGYATSRSWITSADVDKPLTVRLTP